MVHWWWCCLFRDSNGLLDIIVDVVEILTIPFDLLNSLTLLALLVNITSFIVLSLSNNLISCFLLTCRFPNVVTF